MRVFKRDNFTWRGLDLCVGKRKPILTLVPDVTHPHLYRIRYPNGWTSSPANISRAKEAAPGHAQHLMGEQRPVEPGYSGVSPLPVEGGAR